jgi:hypothetical protein
MTQTHTDLLIRIGTYNPTQDNYPVEALLGDGSFFFGGQLRLDEESLLANLLAPEAYGRQLFEALFSGPIREAYDQVIGLARAQSEGNLRLRLWIDPGASELHAIRWERLHHPYSEQWLPLAGTDQTPFSRYLGLEMAQAQPLTAQPLNVLVAVANPVNLEAYGLAEIDVERELESLDQVMSDLPQLRETVQITVMPGRTPLSAKFRAKLHRRGYRVLSGPTSLEALLRELDGCHLLHFLGHGSFSRRTEKHGQGQAALILEHHQTTAAQVVKDDTLVKRLAALDPIPHLIFLSACDSGKWETASGDKHPQEHPFIGLGAKLVQAGVPAVVAMQDLVPVSAARRLSHEFYLDLGQHGLVDRALNHARQTLFDSYPQAWDVPVLFMRLETGQLLATNPIRTALKAIKEHHDEFFAPSPTGRYLDLPVEVIHLTEQQVNLSAGRLVPQATARLDLLAVTLKRFEQIGRMEGRHAPHLVVLVGGYGTNRTTQLKRLAWQTAQMSLTDPERQIMPVYLAMQHYSFPRSSANPIEGLILAQIQRFWPDLTAAGLRKLLEGHLTLRILVDGSEHLPERERYTAWEHFKALMKQYPEQEYLVATDPESLLSPRFDKSGLQLHIFQVQPLAERKVRRFLRNLSRTDVPERREVSQKLLAALDEVHLFDLTAEPWFLVRLFRQAEKGTYPTSRTEVLQQLVDDYIIKIPADRGMRAHTEETIYTLAWQMQSAGKMIWPINDAFATMQAIRGNRGYNLETFCDKLIESELLARVGEHGLRFTYAPIQAYCCAQAIRRMPVEVREQTLDDLTATLGRLTRLRRWEETLVFLSGLLVDEPKALEELLWLIVYGVNLLEGEQVFLAARCLMESMQFLGHKRLNPAIVELANQIINALVWRLKRRNEPQEENRIRAVQMLGQLGYIEYLYPAIEPHLVEVAYEKARCDARGRLDYYYSSMRFVAATALQDLIAYHRRRTRRKSRSRQQQAHLKTNRAEMQPLLDLFKQWNNEAIEPLVQLIGAAPEALESLAALVLGDLRAQFENLDDPELNALSEQITICLIDAFFSFRLSQPMLWAVTHALSMLNSIDVDRHVILPFIEQEARGELHFEGEEAERARIRWHKCMAYLIGSIRSQEPAAHQFLLERCLKQFPNDRLWISVIDALRRLADQRYKGLLEDIASGDFSQLAPDGDELEGKRAVYLQRRAIEALAGIGDGDTLEKLRQSSFNWSDDLRQVFYRTSEEIHWRLSQSPNQDS